MTNRIVSALTIAALAAGSLGCSSLTKSEKGALIGAAAGGAAGAVIGNQAGNTAVGAILGAAVGGIAGGIIGSYMDRQAEEMERDLEGARIERVGEGIKVTFDSGILFAVNKSDLQPEAQRNLTDLARILTKYEDTNILIEGHTDADGTESYNQGLSERRANSVEIYLAAQGVKTGRLTTMGYGETQPIADNDSSGGKAQNRRVEVAIFANDKLKKAAEKQAREQG